MSPSTLPRRCVDDESILLTDIDRNSNIDIILTFCTGFVHDGHLIMDPKATAHHYFEFWFWIDVFASIPFEMFMQNTDKNSRKSIKKVKWFKIPRLLRIGRLLKKMKGAIICD